MKYSKVYQFKITLKDTRPPVWRRIQVPETFTFWDLHCAIQDAMGWLDMHLHAFRIFNPKIGIKSEIGMPDPEFEFDRNTLPGWKQHISKWFTPVNSRAAYMYDFGDGWDHQIDLEKILPCEAGVKYPCCIAGKRACPPEDCGGTYVYREICNGKPEHRKEYPDFDPDDFNPEEIVFSDSRKRLRVLLSDDM